MYKTNHAQLYSRRLQSKPPYAHKSFKTKSYGEDSIEFIFHERNRLQQCKILLP
jgi:hypothetical protein